MESPLSVIRKRLGSFLTRSNAHFQKYVTPSGSEQSYTSDLSKAQVYTSREKADSNRCGNESVVPLSSILNIH